MNKQREMNYFQYGDIELRHLKEKDPILGEQIEKLGMLYRQINEDIFSELIFSIISQQISTKAALTVKDRLISLIGDISPENIHKTSVEDIQSCGMSMRKAEYIKGIGEAAINKSIDFDNLKNLSDEEVIKELTKLKGVGGWTVEMLLIHSLKRPDVVSYKDLAIRKGMMKLYGLDDLSKEEFNLYRKSYSPHGTVASIYIWEISLK